MSWKTFLRQVDRIIGRGFPVDTSHGRIVSLESKCSDEFEGDLQEDTKIHS